MLGEKNSKILNCLLVKGLELLFPFYYSVFSITNILQFRYVNFKIQEKEYLYSCDCFSTDIKANTLEIKTKAVNPAFDLNYKMHIK